MPNLVLDQVVGDAFVVATAAQHSRNVSLDLTLTDPVLDAVLARDCHVALDQIIGPVSLSMTAWLGRVLTFTHATKEAVLTAHVTLGERPIHPALHAHLYNLTGPVRATGGAILCFVGPPWKTIEWRVLQGHGTLTPFTTFSDELGRCSCRYDAGGFAEHAVIGAAFVP